MNSFNNRRKTICTQSQRYINLYYYLMSFFLFEIFIFLGQSTPTPLYLSREKTKEQFGKNTTLTPTKILPKK